MKRTFETAAPLAIHVRLPAGSVRVEAADTGTTEVELEPLDDGGYEAVDAARVELRDARGGQELLIEVPERRGFFGRNPQVAIRIHCPAESSLDVRTRSADVEGRGRLSSLEAKSASGDIDVEHVEGEIAIGTASGDVQVGHAGGPTAVSTASGDVTLDYSAGRLKTNLVSGDLTVREAEGQIETHSVSGDQRLDAVGPGSVSGNSVSGDILVRVRRGSNVWMDVRSVSGDTHSALEPSDAPETDASQLVELRLASVSGDIQIEPAGAAAPSNH
jgi:DUF4097 and DUF4098 domain-containing protein YvlB